MAGFIYLFFYIDLKAHPDKLDGLGSKNSSLSELYGETGATELYLEVNAFGFDNNGETWIFENECEYRPIVPTNEYWVTDVFNVYQNDYLRITFTPGTFGEDVGEEIETIKSTQNLSVFPYDHLEPVETTDIDGKKLYANVMKYEFESYDGKEYKSFYIIYSDRERKREIMRFVFPREDYKVKTIIPLYNENDIFLWQADRYFVYKIGDAYGQKALSLRVLDEAIKYHDLNEPIIGEKLKDSCKLVLECNLYEKMDYANSKILMEEILKIEN